MTDRARVHGAAEVALAAVTVVVVVGMARLFEGTDWLLPLLANAVVAHTVVAVLRRRGLGLAPSAVACAGGAALVGLWSTHWSTTALGLPTGATWSAVRADLDSAWSLYQDVVAPAPAEPGFVLISALALWIIAYVADWAAFRLWVPFEATLPAGTLFLFTALLGGQGGRDWAVGGFAAAVLAFLLLHRLVRQDGTSHWVGEGRGHGRQALLTAGGALGVLAVVAGTVLGPALPGADGSGVLDPRSLRDDEPSRKTVSPLVDIRARLIQLSDVELFQVRSERPSYWRLTSLDRFDGRIWSSSGSYSEADATLPAEPSPLPHETFRQSYAISNLAQIWLPGAYEPRALEIDGPPILYDEESSTLIVDRELDTSDGLTYSVVSASPRIRAADLAGAGGEVPADIQERYTQMDAELRPEVLDLARSLTAGAASPQEAARAIQDHLRTFTYDLAVDAGHSGDDLARFLFETQRGFCEQFAGAFAALARAAGLPARVAVGFTQGQTDPADPTLYHVRGEHAHAWPEVYVAGAGWVSYEPTPGRGMPFAEDYTGVAPAQAAAGQPNQAEVTPTTVPTPGETPGATPPPTPPGATEGELDTTPGADLTPDPDSSDPWLVRWVLGPALVVLAVVVGSGLLYAVVLPLLSAALRRQRRRRAQRPTDQVAVAWAETTESARLLGRSPRRSDTPAEAAAAIEAGLVDADAGAAVVTLAELVERATYSADGVEAAAAQEASEAAERVVRAVRAQSDVPTRLRAALDPRPPLRQRRIDRAQRQRRITATVSADREAANELAASGDRG